MDDKEKNLINSENLNSQNNVGSFPIHNNTFVNSTDKSDINNRINNTKGRNLQNNMESRETSNTSLGVDSLEKKDKLDKGSLGKNALNSAGNALLNIQRRNVRRAASRQSRSITPITACPKLKTQTTPFRRPGGAPISRPGYK